MVVRYMGVCKPPVMRLATIFNCGPMPKLGYVTWFLPAVARVLIISEYLMDCAAICRINFNSSPANVSGMGSVSAVLPCTRV